MGKTTKAQSEPGIPPIVEPVLEAITKAGIPTQKAIDFLKGAIARWGLGPELEAAVEDFVSRELGSQVSEMVSRVHSQLVSEIMALARTRKSDVPPSDAVNLA